MNQADEKIQNVFAAEFSGVVFEVFSENGEINEKSTIFTVFADGDMETERAAILEYAKTVFDEVFTQPANDTTTEMVFFGLLTDKGE